MPLPILQPEVVPEEIGPFRIVRQIGAGGLGRVFLAERKSGFAQRVAIKVLYPLPTETSEEAGLREQQILNSLDHENIARILDHGITLEGLRYLVLEYVDGLPIDLYCATRRLSIESRLRLLNQVMTAVGYAHRHLIVHADIKPSNIMVAGTDSGETVKLLDFGVAQSLRPITDHRGGDLVPAGYTPQFSAPEQRQGKPVTAATDIYALGLISSLLLSGTMDGVGDGKERGQPMTQRMKRMPVADLNIVAAERSATGKALIKMLADDLDAIVQKALEAAEDERYATVDAMREDLLAYLDGRETSVLPANPIRRIGLWARRNRLAAASVSVVTLILLLSASGVLWTHSRVVRQRYLARERLREVIRLTGTLEDELYRSTASLEGSANARHSLVRTATQTIDEIADSSRSDSEIAVELAQQYSNLAELEAADTQDPSARARGRDDIAKGLALLRSFPSDANSRQVAGQLSAVSAQLNDSAF